MRVISISLDKTIPEKGSPAFQRMKTYASLVEEMHIVCLTLGETARPLQDGNLFVYPTNSKRLINFIVDAYKIGKEIIERNNLTRNDSIITTQDPFETGIPGYLLKIKFNLNLNTQDHGNVFESKYWRKESIFNFFRYFLGKFLIKHSNTIRTVSLREKQYLEKNLLHSPEKIMHFPIFTDWEKISAQSPRFDIKHQHSGFDFYILTICRLEKVKNIPLLLSSFSAILEEFPKTLLIIVGKGSQKNAILSEIIRRNLQKNVVMKEWTDDTVSYYKTADLFVLTSFSEGWGLTIIEAAASHCPVIMTDTGCANEFIFNQKNGWVVKINDKPALTEAMKYAIKHEEMRAIFSQAAFNDLKSLPSKEETLKKLKKSWELTLTQQS